MKFNLTSSSVPLQGETDPETIPDASFEDRADFFLWFKQFWQAIREKGDRLFHIWRTLLLVWECARILILASIVLILLQGILPLLSLHYTKQIIDGVSLIINSPELGGNFNQIRPIVIFCGLAIVGTILCRSLANIVNKIQSLVFTDYIQSKIQSQSVAIALEAYDRSEYYNMLKRACQEAPYRPTQIVNNLVQFSQKAISFFSMAGLLFFFHWSAPFILFLTALPSLATQLVQAEKIYDCQRQLTEVERKSQYINSIVTEDKYAREVRLFNLGSFLLDRYQEIRDKLRQQYIRLNLRTSAKNILSQLISNAIVFGFYIFIVYRTVQGFITLGDLVIYYQALQRGSGALQGMFVSFSKLYEHNLFIHNLFEFLDFKLTIAETENPQKFPQPIQQGIVFNGVCFRYPSSQQETLTDISLSIKPGEKIALVGENGSGKTTLVKLLGRLYDIDRGSITIDGIDLREFPVTALRREISIVFQDYARYHLTVKENIWLGNIDSPLDSDKIIAAARDAGVDELISQLPQGYETILGKRFDGGEELSVGQWQKVALARSFLRDSQLLILDEPNSALDPKAEERVFQQFHQLLEDKAAILISHRLSSVKMADRIYVMEKGRIAESGTHEELMQLGGIYFSLFETQAQYYR
ncbi:MAG: ABC transporter ATP-binding protein [Cyanobacteria bacterium SBLK]|nr:ABC transporter ATP-binding protein [Cyanobacteria bacterium SBLK]